MIATGQAPPAPRTQTPQTPRRRRLSVALKRKRSLLQRKAGAILGPEKLPGYRVSICHRDRIPAPSTTQEVEIKRGRDGNCFQLGLKSCGLVWLDPWCAAKITEVRRTELRDGIERWQAQGNVVAMLTLTAPHSAGDHPRMMCDRFVGKSKRVVRKDGKVVRIEPRIPGALKLLQNRKIWRRWAAAVGLRPGGGTVRALEYTIGKNGPHVHLHILLFIESVGNKSFFLATNELIEAWLQACKDAGFRIDDEQAFREHALKITVGKKEIGDYVSKWGLDHELTKTHCKKGRSEDGLTPWDLLERADWTGRDWYGQEFKKYAVAFFNRRQLVFSKGLRDKLGLGIERTDEEIADGAGEQGEHVEFVPDADLERVWKYRALWQILVAAEKCGAEGVRRMLDVLKDREMREWYEQQKGGCNDP